MMKNSVAGEHKAYRLYRTPKDQLGHGTLWQASQLSLMLSLGPPTSTNMSSCLHRVSSKFCPKTNKKQIMMYEDFKR